MYKTRLAQLVERRTFNPVVVGSIPTSGAFPIRLTVMISDFHSEDPGSIPG
jgi:hypothetical protein